MRNGHKNICLLKAMKHYSIATKKATKLRTFRYTKKKSNHIWDEKQSGKLERKFCQNLCCFFFSIFLLIFLLFHIYWVYFQQPILSTWINVIDIQLKFSAKYVVTFFQYFFFFFRKIRLTKNCSALALHQYSRRFL